ncbi:MAG: hypothetical protein OXJ90_28845 [Spirochaetaceae bacterium]|nr:hypothetical protein [Spirochaetaceae bacterium]
MPPTITPRLIELTYEAALKSYWRKKALRMFLRTSSVSDSYLSSWAEDETKRVFLDRLFEELQTFDDGKSAIAKMAKSLSEQTTFPDLRNWEDSKQKIAEAQIAVHELGTYLRQQSDAAKSEQTRKDTQRRAQEAASKLQRSISDRQELQRKLDELRKQIGTPEGGFAFEKWFYDFLDYSDIANKRPYRSRGRQIDGSVTHDGTTYLVELKFTEAQSDATDIDSLKSKVESKADNTMGIFLSMSGYSKVAVDEASGRRSTLLLLDHGHVYLCLLGALDFGDIISRVRRHASQTGESYLPTGRFGD